MDAVEFKKIMKNVEQSRAGIKLQTLSSQGQCIYQHAALYIKLKSRLSVRIFPRHTLYSVVSV